MSNKFIVNKIKNLKNAEAGGKPNAAWVKANREIMMNQIRPLTSAKSQVQESYYLKLISNLSQSALRPAFGVIAVIALYFVSTATMSVASASLPGDALYPIKTASEKVQLALTFSDENKIKLKMDFVSRRGDELQQIARKPEDTQSKVANIETAVKQISADVKDVNTQLNKITGDADTGETIEVVKQIDDKTQKVEKDLVEAHALLSNEVKKEVGADVKEAITNTGDTGAKALAVIVEKGKDGDSDAMSDAELTSRVASRIKTAEDNLVVAVAAVQKAVTSTLLTSTTSDPKVTLPASTNLIIASVASSTTAADIAQKPVQAAAAIEEAKSLLEKKDFSSALQKIVETKTIVGEVIDQTPALTEAVDKNAVNADNTVSSTTPAVVATGTPAVK